MSIRLAHELTPEQYFEHEYIVGSQYHNNASLFFFGSSLDDRETLEVLKANPVAAKAADANDTVGKVLKHAIECVTGLDALGLSEKFDDSVGVIFVALGLPLPKHIVSARVTDELTNTDPRFLRVPPVEMTTRLSSALHRLTRYDQVIYDIAKQEFERRAAIAAGR